MILQGKLRREACLHAHWKWCRWHFRNAKDLIRTQGSLHEEGLKEYVEQNPMRVRVCISCGLKLSPDH